MWLAAICGEEGGEGFFLQPEVRRRHSGRGCVCDAFFASERCSAGLLVHLYRCGLVSGTGGRRAREILQRSRTSKVAAWSADDFTVRRGATRPVAPWRASAIAAHFILQ